MWRNKLNQYVLLDDALCNEKAPDTCTVSQSRGGGGHFHIEGVGDVPLARV